MKNVRTKVTLNSLATTLDSLARMVAKGFENTATKADIFRLEQRITRLEGKVGVLEQGQEEIKLRLDRAAHRFELQELQKRVERLEHKVGIQK